MAQFTAYRDTRRHLSAALIAGIGLLVGADAAGAQTFCTRSNDNTMSCRPAFRSGPADTQTCTQTGRDTMYCRPAFGSGETDAEAAMRAAERARDSAQANAERARPPGRGPGVVGFIQDMQQANRQKKVGKLMAAGQCDEARKTALAAGDLALADYVQSRCGGGSPQLTQGSGDPSLPPAPMDDTGVRMWVVRNVQTAGWVYAGFDGDGAYLYSAGGPIANPDGTFQLWVNDEVFRPRPQEPASGTLRYEGDCAHRLLRVTKLVTFSRRNLDGDSTSKEFPEAKWEAPQGLAADLLGRFCSAFARSSAVPASR